MSLLLDALKRHAKNLPERLALIGSEDSITYADLLPHVAVKASQLRGRYCRVLGIQLDNSPAWVLWDLATVQAGVVCVPLPTFFTQQQLEHVIQAAGIDHLVTPQGLIPTGFVGTPRTPVPEGMSKITFTSGTTGTPKGVCLSQDGLEQVAQSLLGALGDGYAANHLSVLPLAILLENVAGVYSALLAGARCHLYSLKQIGMGNPFQLDFCGLVLAMVVNEISSAILVPELLRGLIAMLYHAAVRLPDMKFLAVGGSKVAPELLLQAQAVGLPIFEGYGLSECGSVVALNTPTDARVGAVGKVLPHIGLSCDGGEIIIHNPAFLGYLGAPHHGEFATGDLGHLDADGFLHISGRKKNLLITSFGRNISPEWVESVLLSQPEIAQAVVYGDAQPYLGALLVPAAPEADVEAAVQRANQGLPDYAKVQVSHCVPPFRVTDGTLTSTGRPRRETIFNQYHHLMDKEK